MPFPQIQIEHMGRRRSELTEVLLEELLWMHRWPYLGRGQRGCWSLEGLSGGTQETVGGGGKFCTLVIFHVILIIITISFCISGNFSVYLFTIHSLILSYTYSLTHLLIYSLTLPKSITYSYTYSLSVTHLSYSPALILTHSFPFSQSRFLLFSLSFFLFVSLNLFNCPFLLVIVSLFFLI